MTEKPDGEKRERRKHGPIVLDNQMVLHPALQQRSSALGRLESESKRATVDEFVEQRIVRIAG